MLLEPAEAADRGPSHGTVLAMDRARAAGVAQPLGRTDLGPGPSHTPVRSKQGSATWGAHPTLGTRTAKPGSSPPAVQPETNTNPHQFTTPRCKSHAMVYSDFMQFSHPFPLPNPNLYLGIPCALVKLWSETYA